MRCVLSRYDVAFCIFVSPIEISSLLDRKILKSFCRHDAMNDI